MSGVAAGVLILALVGLGQNHGGDGVHADAAGGSAQRGSAGLVALDIDGPGALGQGNAPGCGVGVEDDEDVVGILSVVAVDEHGDHVAGGGIGLDTAADIGSIVHTQGGVCLTEGDQALVVLDVCSIVRSLQFGPLDVVDEVGGVVAVLAAVAVLLQLLAEEFLTGMDEGNALCGQVDSSSQVAHLLDAGIDAGSAGGLDDLVDQGVVVVAGSVLDDLLGIAGPPGLCHEVGSHIALAVAGTGNEAGGVAVVAGQQVTDAVGEIAEAGGLGRVALLGHFGAGLAVGAVHVPALAVEDHVGAALMDFGDDLVDGLHIQQANQVEAEAVDVVFLMPVQHGFHDVLADHLTLGSGVVAAAGGVGVHTGEVAGNDVVEAELAGVVNVVVDHVHNHADAMLMQRHDHLLELVDAGCAIIGVGGVGALGGVVVLRIVAPVEGIAGGLIHGAVVIDRQQMQVGDAQLVQVVDTGGHTVGGGGAFLGEGQVLAAVGLGDTGAVIDGEVTDVELVDDGIGLRGDGVGVLVISPALGVGGIQVHDHAALAVDAGGTGVGVNRLNGLAVHGDCVGIVDVLQVALNGHGPDALVATGHGIGAQVGGASLGIAAGGVQLHADSLSGGSPDIEGGGGNRVGCAQGVVDGGVGIFFGELVGGIDGVDADGVAVAVEGDFVLVQVHQIQNQALGHGHGVGIAVGSDGNIDLLAVLHQLQFGSGSSQRQEGGHSNGAVGVVQLQVDDLVVLDHIGAQNGGVGQVALVAAGAGGIDVNIDGTGNDIRQVDADLRLLLDPILGGTAQAGLQVDIQGVTAHHSDGGDHIAVAVVLEVLADAVEAVAPDIGIPYSGSTVNGGFVDAVGSVVVEVDGNFVVILGVGVQDQEVAVAVRACGVHGVSNPVLAHHELVAVAAGLQIVQGNGPDAAGVLGHGIAAGPVVHGAEDRHGGSGIILILEGNGGAVHQGADGDGVAGVQNVGTVLALAVGGGQNDPLLGLVVDEGAGGQQQVDGLCAVVEDEVQTGIGLSFEGDGHGVEAVVALGDVAAGPAAAVGAGIGPGIQVDAAPAQNIREVEGGLIGHGVGFGLRRLGLGGLGLGGLRLGGLRLGGLRLGAFRLRGIGGGAGNVVELGSLVLAVPMDVEGIAVGKLNNVGSLLSVCGIAVFQAVEQNFGCPDGDLGGVDIALSQGLHEGHLRAGPFGAVGVVPVMDIDLGPQPVVAEVDSNGSLHTLRGDHDVAGDALSGDGQNAILEGEGVDGFAAHGDGNSLGQGVTLGCGQGSGIVIAFFDRCLAAGGDIGTVEGDVIGSHGSSDGGGDSLGLCVEGDGHGAAGFRNGNYRVAIGGAGIAPGLIPGVVCDNLELVGACGHISEDLLIQALCVLGHVVGGSRGVPGSTAQSGLACDRIRHAGSSRGIIFGPAAGGPVGDIIAVIAAANGQVAGLIPDFVPVMGGAGRILTQDLHAGGIRGDLDLIDQIAVCVGKGVPCSRLGGTPDPCVEPGACLIPYTGVQINGFRTCRKCCGGQQSEEHSQSHDQTQHSFQCTVFHPFKPPGLFYRRYFPG